MLPYGFMFSLMGETLDVSATAKVAFEARSWLPAASQRTLQP